LDIFSKRAQTREARLQVDLAKMQYSLPRLTRMWGHLDREGGGGGGGGSGKASRGMGEQQVEVDRRLARNRIDQCKRELAEVRKQRNTRRKEREKQGTCCAAIAGYTNAGKSTLLNKLSGSDVMAEDMLFATLDTTTRAIEMPNGQPLLLTDTVGFVRNLPHRLVEAFKATLEESVLADFIIHVLDASSPEVEKFYQTTIEVLAELGAGDKPIITVLNKVDTLNDPVKLAGLEVLFPNTVAVSAKTGLGMEALLQMCADLVSDRVQTQIYRIPQSRGDLSGMLHRDAKVLETDYEGNDVVIKAVVPASIAGRLADFLDPAGN
jgi:GTP-binding protein HflX